MDESKDVNPPWLKRGPVNMKALERELRQAAEVAKITGKMPLREAFNRIEVEPFHGNLAYKQWHGTSLSLCELSANYTFFTHALLFLYGNLTVDPVQEIWDDFALGDKIFWLQSDVPFFEGLFFRNKQGRTNRSWNHILMGCEKEIWPDLLCELQCISGINLDEKRFFRTIAQNVPVVDQLYHARYKNSPTTRSVDVCCLAYDGNDKAVSFEPVGGESRKQARLRKHNPDPDTISWADALFRDDLTPLMASPHKKRELICDDPTTFIDEHA